MWRRSNKSFHPQQFRLQAHRCDHYLRLSLARLSPLVVAAFLQGFLHCKCTAQLRRQQQQHNNNTTLMRLVSFALVTDWLAGWPMRASVRRLTRVSVGASLKALREDATSLQCDCWHYVSKRVQFVHTTTTASACSVAGAHNARRMQCAQSRK